MFDLTGRVALVTGASSGIGQAAACALAGQGATVYLNGRRRERLEQVAAELAGRGLHAVPLPFDVTDVQASCQAIDRLVQDAGRLDICFANAGIQHRASLQEFALADFQRILHADLTAQWAMGRHVAAQMTRQGHGRLIFTGSVTALGGRPGVAAYSLAKAALHAMVRQWVAELGDSGVTVNAIAPGYIRTDLTTALDDDAAFRQWLDSRCPQRRWGTPDDIAPAVVFLASDESRFMTGQTMVVDGGLTAVL